MDTAAHGTVVTEQKFADGRVHLRETCRGCGGFLKWAQQGLQSFGDRCVELIERLSEINYEAGVKAHEVVLLVDEARQLVHEARLGKIRK